MAISASYTAHCDGCGTDAGASRPTEPEAIEYVRRGGWVIPEAGCEWWGYALCEDCQKGRCRAVVGNEDGTSLGCMGEPGHQRDHGPWKLISSPPIIGLAVDTEGGRDDA
jgi:hypothetical protein